MAFWIVGGGPPDVLEQQHHQQHPHSYQQGPSIHGGKRRATHYDDGYGLYDYGYELSKRTRLHDWRGGSICQRHGHQPLAEPNSVPVRNLAFVVLREGSQGRDDQLKQTYAPPPLVLPPPALGAPVLSSLSLERTESGLSISSETTSTPYSEDDEDEYSSPGGLLGDLAAADLVRTHMTSCRSESQSARILKSLIRPRPGAEAFPLDNDALRSIFSAANDLFFAGRLARRVAWDWSQSSPHYARHVVGTTALRRSARLGGYETLIVLSSPILRDTRYNRRLLIATFLHEMIHSFLFVICGWKARRCGGHTEGFRMIAETIDEWVGRDYLRLGDLEADLERFRGQGGGESGGW